VNTPHKGCGCTGDEDRGECCKIGCFCCDFGLIWPTYCCGCAQQCCCCYSVANFPCSREFIPAPVCTLCPFCQICPRCGCCMAPPPCPAMDKVLNDGHVVTAASQQKRQKKNTSRASVSANVPSTQRIIRGNDVSAVPVALADPLPRPVSVATSETIEADGSKIVERTTVLPDGTVNVSKTVFPPPPR